MIKHVQFKTNQHYQQDVEKLNTKKSNFLACKTQ